MLGIFCLFRSNIFYLFLFQSVKICCSLMQLHNVSCLRMPISDHGLFLSFREMSVCQKGKKGDIMIHGYGDSYHFMLLNENWKNIVLSVIVITFHLQLSCRRGKIYNWPAGGQSCLLWSVHASLNPLRKMYFKSTRLKQTC